jgi:hypothetical protein
MWFYIHTVHSVKSEIGKVFFFNDYFYYIVLVLYLSCLLSASWPIRKTLPWPCSPWCCPPLPSQSTPPPPGGPPDWTPKEVLPPHLSFPASFFLLSQQSTTNSLHLLPLPPPSPKEGTRILYSVIPVTFPAPTMDPSATRVFPYSLTKPTS